MLADLIRVCSTFRDLGDVDALQWAHDELLYLVGVTGEDMIEALCRGLEAPAFADLED